MTMSPSGVQLRGRRPGQRTIIPNPLRVDMREGHFQFGPAVRVAADVESTFAADFLVAALTSAGCSASTTDGDGDITLRIVDDPSIPVEGYRIDVRPDGISIMASTKAGLFYGSQTLTQMIPADFSESRSIPCALVEDRPRFAWRGVMIDVSRHFMPLPFLRRMVDLLAMHKMNTLHLHLTDDQGWRMEIKKYPRLTEVGGFREGTLVGHLEHSGDAPHFDGIRHGGFYTQDELRDLVHYASERAVTIVPEIEMPGHAQAAVAAYPELGVLGESVEVCKTWGVIQHIFNPFESTIEFLQDVLTEVMDVFPSTFIHIGGDEAVKNQWKASTAVQDRIRELGLSNEDEMQSYFVGRMSRFLANHGRRLIGWDEIIEGGLAENAAVMSWRGEGGGVTAAAAGHDVVMTPVGFTYLDLYQSRAHEVEPVAQGGYLPLERVYQYEPIPAGLDGDRARHVLGTQAQLWTEYMPTPEHVEYMAFPRLCALAEVAWSDPDRRDWQDFVERLIPMLGRLDAMNVRYRSLGAK